MSTSWRTSCVCWSLIAISLITMTFLRFKELVTKEASREIEGRQLLFMGKWVSLVLRRFINISFPSRRGIRLSLWWNQPARVSRSQTRNNNRAWSTTSSACNDQGTQLWTMKCGTLNHWVKRGVFGCACFLTNASLIHQVIKWFDKKFSDQTNQTVFCIRMWLMW